jgi:hypothetical protein
MSECGQRSKIKTYSILYLIFKWSTFSTQRRVSLVELGLVLEDTFHNAAESVILKHSLLLESPKKERYLHYRLLIAITHE